MGCSSSKRIEAAVDVYRPPPTSFAVFDISSIKEPWLDLESKADQEHHDRPSQVPAPILEKLNKLETGAPRSWDEVSEALEHLKPTLNNNSPPPVAKAAQAPQKKEVVSITTVPGKKEGEEASRKRGSIHTLEELDAKLSTKPVNEGPRKIESLRSELKKVDVASKNIQSSAETDSSGGAIIKPVKENIFILRDRLEREKEGKAAIRRDPLREFPEKCPPGGADLVVMYTTSLRGVRRTFEDCTRVREVLEGHHVAWDERDVSLHREFLKELKELVGEEEEEGGVSASVPRVSVKGRYIGGAKEVVELNESGRLGRILSWARVEKRQVGMEACAGCGVRGARFVPCLGCGGSCKVVIDGVKERCDKCNENGLVRCPACL